MIITGWQSCKYSIFYLASLTYRAVAMGACCDARGGEGGTRPGLVDGPPGGLRAASSVAQPRAHASRGAAAAVGRPGRAACLHARAGGGGDYLLRLKQEQNARGKKEARAPIATWGLRPGLQR